MRFVCDSCQAQYMISEDKLGAKGAKVRCKRCGHVILVRRPEVVPLPQPFASEAAPASAPPAGEAQDAKDDKKVVSAAEILEGVQDDEIGAVFEKALTESPESASPSNGAPSTDQLPPNDMPFPSEAPLAPAGLPASAPSHEWFVAIDDKQVGPITQDKVKQLWDSGEVGPDSLCWRVGLADWKPLSEMSELSSLLAPRPAKPMIIAPPGATSGAAPVESVFAPAPRGERAEVPAASTAAVAESSGWRPSAANALASLLQEEMKALSRPAPAPPPAAEAPQTSRPAVQTSPLMQPTPFDAPIGVASVPRFGSYTEPRSHKGVIIGGLVGGLVVAAAVAVTFYFARNPQLSLPILAASPQKAPSPEPAKAAATTPAATAGTPTPPPPAASAAKTTEQKTETTVAAKTESASAPTNGEQERTSSRRERRHRSRSSSSSEQVSQGDKSERPMVARAVEAPTEASDDEFQKEFGGGGERAASSRSQKRSVYVPPAPGSASSDLPDMLGQSDIMSVVVQNKPSIMGCVSEQKKRDPSLSGRMVMRWQIHPNGRTSNVSCQSEEFKGTPLANCLAGLIKTWSFPKHRIQGEPINFPFTF